MLKQGEKNFFVLFFFFQGPHGLKGALGRAGSPGAIVSHMSPLKQDEIKTQISYNAVKHVLSLITMM